MILKIVNFEEAKQRHAEALRRMESLIAQLKENTPRLPFYSRRLRELD